MSELDVTRDEGSSPVAAAFLVVGAAFVALRAPGRSESKANGEASSAEGALTAV